MAGLRSALLGAIALLVLFASAVATDLASIHTHRMDLRPKDSADRVYLHTCFGAIPIKLLSENAPKTAARVLELSKKGSCEHCAFYRAEARPTATVRPLEEGGGGGYSRRAS